MIPIICWTWPPPHETSLKSPTLRVGISCTGSAEYKATNAAASALARYSKRLAIAGEAESQAKENDRCKSIVDYIIGPDILGGWSTSMAEGYAMSNPLQELTGLVSSVAVGYSDLSKPLRT